MLDNFNQPKGSTIGVLKDGRTVQSTFDELHGALNLSNLRYMTFTEVGQEVVIGEHTAGQGMGGGTFRVISLTPGSYVDDNGCQIITNSGVVLRRKTHFISSDMFGLQGGGDIIACLNNMYKASRTLRIEEVLICRQTNGQTYRADTRTTPGFSGDVTDGFGFYIKGLGVGNRGPRIDHVGGGVLFKIFKDRNVSSDFWVTCGISRLVIQGRSDAWTGSNTTVDATPIRIQDVIGAEISDIFIQGYRGNTSGAAISLYNVTGWTELARFDNVMVRNSAVILRLHRDPNGNGGTDSFFGLKGNIEANAGATGPTTFLRLGDGTYEGRCFLYGHDLKITGWMSSSAGHVGIRVTDYSTCTEGLFTFVFDGYGISAGATAPVISLIRTDGLNSRFDCDVRNYSGQSGRTPLSILQHIWNSCVHSSPEAINKSLNNAYPCVRPRGMRLSFKGTFTLEETQNGATFPLGSLIPGMKLRVTLHSWNTDKYQLKVSKWDVQVMSIDFPCVITPAFSMGPTLTPTAATVTTPTGTTQALTDVSISHPERVQSDSLGSLSLRLTNGRPNNGTSYLANSGLKLYVELPPDPGASVGKAYSVEIEIL
ncbi:phage tail fiber protein [Klebsiella pneumoniae]|nr:phage tail fiber protein [Klebsiella pneumoniae]